MVVHGYGGLDIDTSSGNVTKAYQDVGYNVIIGMYLKNNIYFNKYNLFLFKWIGKP